MSPAVSCPGVYIQEIPVNTNPVIVGVPTSFTAFVGLTLRGPLNKATRISSFSEFDKIFGGLSECHNLGYAVRHFFLNGGCDAIVVSVGNELTVTADKIIGNKDDSTGIYALDSVDDFDILCIPPYDSTETTAMPVYEKALEYCKKRRAILLVDPPKSWQDARTAKNNVGDFFHDKNAAIYFPRVHIKEKSDFVACGIIAGIIARTDLSAGIWKAPAGLGATMSGISGLAVDLSDYEIGMLNVEAVNCLKNIRGVGFAVWGSRTMAGKDVFGSEWKYLSVRRTALYIEKSLHQGLAWAVFEPNSEPLWSSIRNSVNAFLNGLFREGAFSGNYQNDAYFVKCDATTVTQNDIDKGILNVMVGFAPLKPAEFVIVSIRLSMHTK